MYFLTLLLFCCAINVNSVTSVSVILSADDGWAEHLTLANDLSTLGVKGVFYINSGRINKNNRLTKAQLHQIADQGHEIASHTRLHKKLTSQTVSQQYTAICDDRDKLLSWGFNVTTFAFPYGADTPDSFDILKKCGFNGARDSGGIRGNVSCTRCPKTENIPAANPFQIRSVSYRSTMGVEVLKWYVKEADIDPRYNNGVIIFIFHEYGNHTDKTANIHPSEFKEFVVWLKSNNIKITTTDSIVGTHRVHPNFDKLPEPLSTTSEKPLVVLTFDGGTQDHYLVSQILDQHAMKGTFFINSGVLGQTGFLTSTQIKQMHTNGHEIGGYSQNPKEHIISLDPQEQRLRIQTDYNTLTSLGLNVTSFAWPYGETSVNLTEIVSSTGYKRARDVGGLKVPTSCNLCPSSLEFPLDYSQKMALRSFIVKSSHTPGDLMWQVYRAEEWHINNPTKKSVIIFTFNSVCDGCTTKLSEFKNFITWLKPRYKIGTIVNTLNTLN